MLKLPSAQTSKGNGIFNMLFLGQYNAIRIRTNNASENQRKYLGICLLVHVHFLFYTYIYIYI